MALRGRYASAYRRHINETAVNVGARADPPASLLTAAGAKANRRPLCWYSYSNSNWQKGGNLRKGKGEVVQLEGRGR